ncbi:MAG: aminopeptidase P family protein [Coriobacteriales bacterium]|jgi:Xaa-Pro aminopeptidase|nr:aminopeptidase P family protein [Coriobacteriales bacterium]
MTRASVEASDLGSSHAPAGASAPNSPSVPAFDPASAQATPGFNAAQDTSSAATFSQARLRRLRQQLVLSKLDGIITLNPADQRWLTGWRQLFDHESAHLMLVTQDTCFLHTDSRYIQAMRQADVTHLWHLDARAISHAEYLAEVLADLGKPGFRLGYQPQIRQDVYRNFQARLRRLGSKRPRLLEAKRLLAGLREVKDAEERELMRQAQAITDAAFDQLLTWIKPGMSEAEIANQLEFSLRQLGADGLAFESIVASGPNSALPHARPGRRHLATGDFLLLDFGARYQDYCADMSRTLCIGPPSAQQKRLYDAVLLAHLQARQVLGAGTTGRAAWQQAVAVLDSQGLAEHFLHSLGHGVGIEVHESPTLGPKSTQALVADNVITVEPGVYLAGFGGVRIEDCGIIAHPVASGTTATAITNTAQDTAAAVPNSTQAGIAQAVAQSSATDATGFQSFATSPLELLVI